MEQELSVKIAEKLKDAELRPTRQRIMLGSLLWGSAEDRHITAEILHKEAQHAKMNISLATVYNTLHQFVEVGLLREVSVDASCSYFDTNTTVHHHFVCEETGELADIPADLLDLSTLPTPPCGGDITGVDVVIHVKPKLQSVHA